MLVIDASCLYEVVADGTLAESVRHRLSADPDHAAPHIVDVEVMSVIRRDHHLGRLDPTAAAQAVEDLREWPGERFGHQPLLDRIWELRATVRGWDAAYVALAEALGATLLTLDARVAAAPGPRCRIDVVG
ncbi:MAG: type II toxin-antitoxin system VapC family toxin [Actinomycetota bacterium]|nr:type II toxin-antitoxin system VapC family toxin [Actinomycetota bacterium]MDQ6949663.1 type II toxin-antitoxin system VapC family toxin [Actinomycetota bacterium]